MRGWRSSSHLKWVWNAAPLIVSEETLRRYGQTRKPSKMDPTLSLCIGDRLRVEDQNEIVNEIGRRTEVAAGSGPELGLIEGRALRLRRSFLLYNHEALTPPSNDNISPVIVPSLSKSYSIWT